MLHHKMLVASTSGRVASNSLRRSHSKPPQPGALRRAASLVRSQPPQTPQLDPIHHQCSSQSPSHPVVDTAFLASFAMFLAAGPAHADAIADAVVANPFQSVASNSLYVTLALFVMCVPGGLQMQHVLPRTNKATSYMWPSCLAA